MRLRHCSLNVAILYPICIMRFPPTTGDTMIEALTDIAQGVFACVLIWAIVAGAFVL